MAGLEGSLVVALKDLILDFSEYDVNHVVADIEEIRRYNPQRFEMEQLTAIASKITIAKSVLATRIMATKNSGCVGTCQACPCCPEC